MTADEAFDSRIDAIVGQLRDAQVKVFDPHLRALRDERAAVVRDLEEAGRDRSVDADIVEAGLRFRLERITQVEQRMTAALRSVDRRIESLGDDEPLDA